MSYSVEFEKDVRNRSEEDMLTSYILIQAMAEFFDIHDFQISYENIKQYLIDEDLERELIVNNDMIKEIIENNEVRCIEYNNEELVILDAPRVKRVILAGSFNPLHEGHIKLLEISEKKTKLQGNFKFIHNNNLYGRLF